MWYVLLPGILRNWEPDDDAFSEHRRHFGQCPFLANPDDVGNVKIGQETFPVDDSGAVDEDLNVHAARNDVRTKAPYLTLVFKCSCLEMYIPGG